MNLTDITRKLSRAVHMDRLPESKQLIAMPVLAHVLEQRSVRSKLLPTHIYQINALYKTLERRQHTNPSAHRRKTLEALERIRSRYEAMPERTYRPRLRPLRAYERTRMQAREHARRRFSVGRLRYMNAAHPAFSSVCSVASVLLHM